MIFPALVVVTLILVAVIAALGFRPGNTGDTVFHQTRLAIVILVLWTVIPTLASFLMLWRAG